MDLLSLLGFILGIGFIIVSILLGEAPDGSTVLMPEQLQGFFDLPSIMIVLGGTIAALMISFPLKSFAKIPKHLKIIFAPKKYNPQSYIEQIVFFAKEARINGLLALEDKLNNTQDKFLKSSLLLVVDSVEPEKVKALLNKELEYLEERHAQDMAFYNKASEYAPAFGMTGTLIGLINLLANMSDTEALAKNMSVSLVTTFYGVILANLIFKPIANKLKVRHEEEYLCKMIISEGVQAIQDGDNPTFIQEKLTRLLPSYSLKGELKNTGK
ncbi:motility protein A [Porcipelethomonas sp.]|uniref:motility protein A n=1 Tax=Porcipelethomonas sp. TaxID=2981675 RepID=UPI003EFA4586